MKLIYFFIFCVNVLAYNADKLHRIKKIPSINRTKEIKNRLLLHGAVSTLFPTKFFYQDKKIISKFTLEEEDKIQLGDKYYNYKYNFILNNKDLPTIVVMAGFGGGTDQSFTRLMMSYYGESFESYNFLILETFTSDNNVHRNLFPSLGGLHEVTYLNQAIDNFYKNKFNIDITKIKKEDSYRPKIILIGASASTYAVFHGANYLKRNSKEILGMMIYAGYNNIGTLLQYVCLIDYPRKECNGPTYNFSYVFKKVAPNIFYKVSKEFFSSEPFREEFYNLFPIKKTYSAFYDIINKGFNDHKELLEDLYFEIFNEKIIFKNVFDYYQKISLLEKPNLNTPLLWVHAYDDPVSTYLDQFRPINNYFKDSPFFTSHLLRHGGHGAYARIYGRRWLRKEITMFLDIVTSSSK